MHLGQNTPMRVLRSGLVAALTSCSAALGHTLGGGHRAPILMLVLLAVIGTPIMFAMSGRRWSFPQLVAVMGIAQIILHAVMTVSMPAAHTAHLAPDAFEAATPGWNTMALAHLAMTLGCAAALAHGERMLAWGLDVLAPRVDRPRLHAPTPRRTPHRAAPTLTSHDGTPTCGSRAPPAPVFTH